MTDTGPNDGRIGKEIDWSLVVPSITSRTWEPPALEVLDEWEDEEDYNFNLQSDEMKSKFPNIELHLQLVDLMCEIAPLGKYLDWAGGTLKTAREAGDLLKVSFQEGLIKALEVEAAEVYKEMRAIWNAAGLGTPMSDPRGDTDGANNEAETLSLASSNSYQTAQDDVSTHSDGHNEDLSILSNPVDLDLPSPTLETDSASDGNTILETADITEMRG